MSSESVCNELPPETVVLLARHLCRISGSITPKNLTEHFPGVGMNMYMYILETLLKSHYMKTSVAGTYLFVDLDRDIETGDLQAELDALSFAKERVLVRRGIIQPTSSDGELDRLLKTYAEMTSNSYTFRGEHKVELSLGIEKPTFEDKVAASLSRDGVELISNQSSHPGKPGSASMSRANPAVNGAVSLNQIPARRNGVAHPMKTSDSMKTNSSPRAGAHFSDSDSAFHYVLEGHSNPPQLRITADTPSFKGSVNSTAQPADSFDQDFSAANSKTSTISGMSSLVSGMAALRLSITSDTIRQSSDLRKSHSTEAEATLEEESVEAIAISQEELMQAEGIPGKNSESETSGSVPGLVTLYPSAQNFTLESSLPENERMTSPPENQPESNLPENQLESNLPQDQSKSPENLPNLPKNSSSPSSIPAGPPTSPVAPSRQIRAAPVISSRRSANLHASQPPNRAHASTSAVFAPKYQWTERETGDKVDNALEALETFCRYKGLQPPAYSTTFMPMDRVFFCIVFVGDVSFLSYPMSARSDEEAKEIAAEKAVKELGITSSMLAALLSVRSVRPKTLS